MTVSHELRTPLTVDHRLGPDPRDRTAPTRSRRKAAIETIARSARVAGPPDRRSARRVADDQRQAAARRAAGARRRRGARRGRRRCGRPPTRRRCGSTRSIDPDCRHDHRRSRSAAADRLEPAVERDQVHAGRAAAWSSSVQRAGDAVDDRGPRFRHPASPPTFCRTSSIGSGRAKPARNAATAASGSGWRSCAIWSSCTAAR